MNAKAIAACDSFVYIPLYAQKTASLNVSVAAGIVFHQWALQAKRSTLKILHPRHFVSQHPLGRRLKEKARSSTSFLIYLC